MKQFPFTAVVGMEDAKRSLIYHAIDPRIGGTLLLGHRGCAKTTLVRAFAELLQTAATETIPFVELPLGATEDRLLGSVNAEALVEKNKWETRTGLIEAANGGVLYVDEINLLPDNLADQILDSAASGKHHLERDGILTRQVFPEVPPRVEYTLTARGEGLLVPVKALIAWIVNEWPEIAKSRREYDRKIRP